MEDEVVAGAGADVVEERAGDTAAREAAVICDFGPVFFSSFHVSFLRV